MRRQTKENEPINLEQARKRLEADNSLTAMEFGTMFLSDNFPNRDQVIAGLFGFQLINRRLPKRRPKLKVIK